MATNGDEYPGIEAETCFEVRLYIYDLSKELTKSFKKILKGKPLPGIWHTALVAYGREYYFASSGVESCRPGETILGEPDQILTLGKTELPYSVFLEYIFALGESSYKPGTYHLFEHNCNTFSHEVSNFLTGGPIPEELRELPQEILSNKYLSSTLKEYFDKLSLRVEGSKGISFGNPDRKSSVDQSLPENVKVNGEIVENGQNHPSSSSNKSTKNKQTSKSSSQSQPPSSDPLNPTKKSSKMPTANGDSKPAKEPQKSVEAAASGGEKQSSLDSSSVETPVNESSAPKSNPKPSDEPFSDVPSSREPDSPDDGDAPLPTFTSRRTRKYQEPPITFPDIDGEASYNKIMELVGAKLNQEEKFGMAEILDYIKSTEGGAWALGSPHLDVIGRLLNDRNLPENTPVLMLQILESLAFKEDVILLLHQDREHHHLMSYLYRIENLPEEEQEQIAIFMCNLCHNAGSFDWLMYISEWMEEGHSCNNSRVTIRVAVHSLLCDRPSMQDKGSALMFNLALKELFDDIATELAMAILQFLQAELNEELAFRCLTALLRFMCISYNDVPTLMKMLGPDLRKFKGLSERVNLILEEIDLKQNVKVHHST